MVSAKSVVFHVTFAAMFAAGVVFSDRLINSTTSGIAPIWPPAGIAFACLILGGLRAWPTIVVGVIAGQLMSVPLHPIFYFYALAANVLGPVCATWVLRSVWPQNLVAVRLKTALYLFIGGIILSLIAASIGVLGTWHSGLQTAGLVTTWVQWFLGDLFGVTVCTPALVAAGRVWQQPQHMLKDEAYLRGREKASWMIGVVASAFLWVWLSEKTPQYALAVTFLPLTFLGWSALRFDHLFTSVAVMVLSLIVVTFIGRGLAGFEPPQSTLESAILLLFLSVMAVLPLLVSAAAHQSRYFADQLTYRANHDFLTGLANRSAFEDRLRDYVRDARRHGRIAAAAYVDLDHFKVVNDTCGHTAGDELLKQIAHVLRSNLQQGDYIARFGGDEFGIIFEGADPETAQDRATRLIQLIEEFRFVWRRHIFTFAASCGVVPINRDTESYTRLLADADAACFEAKESGGNRVVVSSVPNEDTGRNTSAMHWAVRITDALEANRLHMQCQEIRSLKPTTPGLHYEMLLRMSDEAGKNLPPSAFIPAAERFKMMPKIDRWVVRAVIDFLARNPDVLGATRLCSINLSGPSVGEASFLDFLQELLDRSGVPCDKLCFEITETAAVGELSHAMHFIDRLRRKGCQFALDDFGSGLSSFGYLRALKVDYLKIDGSFVRDIVSNPVDRAMVRSINEVGQVMGKKTIAEYVETPDIADVLTEIGVDYVQGYAYGRPEPMEKFFADRPMSYVAPPS